MRDGSNNSGKRVWRFKPLRPYSNFGEPKPENKLKAGQDTLLLQASLGRLPNNIGLWMRLTLLSTCFVCSTNPSPGEK